MQILVTLFDWINTEMGFVGVALGQFLGVWAFGFGIGYILSIKMGVDDPSDGRGNGDGSPTNRAILNGCTKGGKYLGIVFAALTILHGVECWFAEDCEAASAEAQAVPPGTEMAVPADAEGSSRSGVNPYAR